MEPEEEVHIDATAYPEGVEMKANPEEEE